MVKKLFIARFAAGIALASFLASVSGCGNGETAAAKGETALRDGNYAAAARSLDKAARKTQATSHLYYNLGAARALSGDSEGAIRAFENAEHADIANLDALEYRACLLAKIGKFADAHELFDRAIDEAADTAVKVRILNALAVVEHRLLRDDLACVRLGQAIRLDPGYSPSYFNFAHVLEEAYQLHGEALKHIRKYIETANADDPRLARAKQFAAVVQAAAIPPPPHTNTLEAAKLLKSGADAYARSRWTIAEETFAKALDADPLSYEAASYLAATRYAARHYDGAAEAYAMAAKLSPNQFEPVFMQGHIAYSLGKPAHATQILSCTAIPKWPDDPRSYEIAAYAWAAQQRYYEARIYGAAYLALAKSAGTDASAFTKWFDTIPSLPFQADK